ncbi:anti-sigma factor family protein [Pseudomonas lopnurensis]|uniref:anti-sigma factor family protein n=1 Tax=Pseudomonas lopnurensis TaxID=1477517 RepID=UPI0028AEA356|nr:zf-HC2 domain-containing protein [Pseudomonas lopnurensis]
MTEHLDMAILSAYLDNELDAAAQRHAAAHLAGCPQCRATLAELDGLGQGLRALACPELPAELQARLQRPFAPPPVRRVSAPRRRSCSACCSAMPCPASRRAAHPATTCSPSSAAPHPARSARAPNSAT